MGLFFLRDKHQNFIAMVAEVTQGVKDLSLGDAQDGNAKNRFALLMQRDHKPLFRASVPDSKRKKFAIRRKCAQSARRVRAMSARRRARARQAQFRARQAQFRARAFLEVRQTIAQLRKRNRKKFVVISRGFYSTYDDSPKKFAAVI